MRSRSTSHRDVGTIGGGVAVLGARILGHDFAGDDVGVWAVGGAGVGPIFALDSKAREWTTWGEAAQSGSSAMEVIERLAGYPETRAVLAAVRSS